MSFSEKWGSSIDEAVRLALIDLKLSLEEVEVTVLEEPSKGFFGIGSKLAKVRVEPKKEKKMPTFVEKKEAQSRREEPAAFVENQKRETRREKPAKKSFKTAATGEKEELKTKKEQERKSGRRAEEKKIKKHFEKELLIRERPENLTPLAEDHAAVEFLRDITQKMNLTLDIKAAGNEDSIYIDIEGKDSGTIIGKRGQTLDAIQYLTNLVVNKDKGSVHSRVVVDAENYRAKREKTLEQLAERLAEKVVKTGRTVKLEPMNPYERKIIHATLQSNPAVNTRSEGDEPHRRVIIELK